MKIKEHLRPKGRVIEHKMAHLRKEDRDFFKENRIELSYERDGKGLIIIYIKLTDYVIRGESPEELIKLVNEKTSIARAFYMARELAEEYMKDISVEEYRRLRRGQDVETDGDA